MEKTKIEARIALLQSRNKDNSGVIRKLQRKLRKLSN